MMQRLSLSLFASLFLVIAACGPSDNSGGDGGPPPLDDRDGDTIGDIHEGCAEGVDTDGDGLLDCDDLDSDGDGINDIDEAGDDQSGTPPVDSDGDGTPDFQDTDSDNNGIPDGIDGLADIDGDGVGNFADLDDDNDAITDQQEIGPDPQNPVDTDLDGIPDFQDFDSDSDTIQDLHEGLADPEMDDIPAYQDLDSDGDCIPDQAEAGDTDLATPPVDIDADGTPSFLDLDSDGDGLLDGAEDANCNGVLDPGETAADNADTDGDGVSDLVEVAAGTDPNNSADNPQANGDFVFIVPFEEPPSPNRDDLDFSTNLQAVDLYVLIDRSGSMSTEIATVRANLGTVITNLTCPPLGNGDPADCIPDVASGAGTVGYIGAVGAYTNHLDIQDNPALTGPSIPTNEPGGCCDEPLSLATWSTVTGQGSAAGGCSIAGSYGGRASCTGSLAGSSGFGFPCFRPGALPVVLLATDEAPTATFNCPAMTTVISAANAVGAKIVGIRGSGGTAQVGTDLNTLATGTGAVDVNAGNAPLVFNGADASAATAIENGIRTLANGIPLDLSAVAVDDPADAVDAVTAFVDHLETLQLGTPECTSGLVDQDTNADTFPDLYVGVPPGTPVCWSLIPRSNTTVEPTDQPQLFTATIQVFGGVAQVDERQVFFVVPPEVGGGPID